jgi:hypothetical protein
MHRADSLYMLRRILQMLQSIGMPKVQMLPPTVHVPSGNGLNPPINRIKAHIKQLCPGKASCGWLRHTPLHLRVTVPFSWA